MRQKSAPAKEPAEKVVKDIRQATRRQFSAEEKIRIVLEGLRGEHKNVKADVASLCLDVGELKGGMATLSADSEGEQATYTFETQEERKAADFALRLIQDRYERELKKGFCTTSVGSGYSLKPPERRQCALSTAAIPCS